MDGQLDGGGGPRDSVPPDPVNRAIELLRLDVPVDERAFDARVLDAVRRDARNRTPWRRRLRQPAVWGGVMAIAASIALLVVTQINSRGPATTPTSHAGAGRLANTEPLITTSAVSTVAMRSDARGVQLVRFRLAGVRARSITVAGTFNGWNVSATPLQRVGATTWVVDVPLRAGRYSYQFVLDHRKWIPDPHAPRDAGDDFGPSNSVVTVAGGNGS